MYNKPHLLMLISRVQPKLLSSSKNINRNPSCLDCLFCIYEASKNRKGQYIYQYKCTQFKPRLKPTQIIAYENITQCRNDENKCGKSGKYYVPFLSLY